MGKLIIIGAGPGDPELLTLKAFKLIQAADVILYDRLVTQPILELARPDALLIETGKKGYGPSWKQEDINAMMVAHARQNALVIRLKSGDPTLFGRLDEEMTALIEADIPFEIVPGVTSATAAAASIKASLTQRGRNSSLRFMTGRDVDGFAEHEWRELAKPGAAAAIYMGAKAARFLRGRLMIHGADRHTSVTAIENASRPDERVIETTLLDLPDDLDALNLEGPVLLLFGITPKTPKNVLSNSHIAEAL